jgi:HEPN domain-containing protein
MEIIEKIKYWLEIALDDLDSDEIMLEKKKYLQSGFYCHQSVEKVLKGYYLRIKQSEPPYTHNLIKLSRESGIDELFNSDQKNLINILMPLNIEARYPDEKMAILKTLDYNKSKDIYNKTAELIKWIQKLILQ